MVVVVVSASHGTAANRARRRLRANAPGVLPAQAHLSHDSAQVSAPAKRLVDALVRLAGDVVAMLDAAVELAREDGDAHEAEGRQHRADAALRAVEADTPVLCRPSHRTADVGDRAARQEARLQEARAVAHAVEGIRVKIRSLAL